MKRLVSLLLSAALTFSAMAEDQPLLPDANAILDTLSSQRNAALDQLAKANGIISSLDAARLSSYRLLLGVIRNGKLPEAMISEMLTKDRAFSSWYKAQGQ